MAIEFHHQDSTSPRISFSFNISPNNNDSPVIIQHIKSPSSSTSNSTDFDFCVFRESTFDHQESFSPADELFFNGRILPIEIKKRLLNPPPPPPSSPPQIIHQTPPSQEKEEEAELKKPPSFWPFKRSTSLNCGGGYARNLCPLPLFSRSNSAGNNNLKRNYYNYRQKQYVVTSSNHLRQPPTGYCHRKSPPPIRKGGVAAAGYGVKVNPVLNVSLFGLLSYVFSSGAKDKSKKRA